MTRQYSPQRDVTVKKFEAYEDNAGGLSLFVFDANGNITYARIGYEHQPGQLSADIQALYDGVDTSEWDDCGNDFVTLYKSTLSFVGAGTNLIADTYGTYPNNMGNAAALDFNITND